MSTLATTNIKHPSSASNNIVLDSAGGVDLDALTVSGSAPADSVNIDASGKLLVGTSSSVGATSGRLQIKGAAGGVAPFAKYSLVSANDEDAGGIALSSSGTNSIAIQADPDNLRASSDISFAVDGTERMRITNAGYIKASNNGSYVSVAGAEHEFRNSSSGSATARFHHAGTANDEYGLSVTTANDQNASSTYFLRCAGSSTERARIRTNGGLANYSANNANLSDINTKKDISPAADTWNCLKEWEIVNYRYKDQPDDADLNLGVIAQQVAESCPEVITIFQEAKEATEDAPAQEERLGVKEQQMYWMAIKALQEAQARIEALEVEVAALKAQ
jgi:hypothetical protein